MGKLFIFLTAIMLVAPSFAQGPTPPSDNPSALGGNNPAVGHPGSGAPVGGGLEIMLMLAVAYGVKKQYDARRIQPNNLED